MLAMPVIDLRQQWAGKGEVAIQETATGLIAFDVTCGQVIATLPPIIPNASGDGGVAVRPELMNPQEVYPFKLFGANMAAIKRDDGSVDFYHLP